MRVKVDRERCYKSGECYYNHPELFEMGDEGYPVILIGELTDPATRRHAEEAAEVCPAMAISLVE